MITGVVVLGTISIGSVLLERHLIKKDRVRQAETLNKITFHGIRCGGILFITYAFIKTVGWFL